MSLSKFVIIFSIIALCFSLPVELESRVQSAISMKQIQYNAAIDNAVDDALEDAKVEHDSGKEIFINKNEVKKCFFRSLYNNFGVQNDKKKQKLLELYIPVMLFTEIDGYYIYRTNTFDDSDGGKRFASTWTEKRKYTYDDQENNIIVNFTLGDDISIYDKSSKEKIEGNWHDVKMSYPDVDYFKNDDDYDTTRRTCIINHLKKDMSYFINNHNRIASAYGIRYKFELPNIDKNDWYRTIDDTGFMVIFQGYPLGNKYRDFYNKYAVGSARIKKENLYYIVKDENGVPYYHRSGCSKITPGMQSEVYYSRRECALQGAYPDSCCD